MQGRFKRDGSASAEPEPHGGTGPMNGGSSPQHAQNQGPAGDGGERSGPTASGSTSPPKGLKPPTGPVGPGPRIALRNWRISTRLVSLLALPVVAATSLGALRINDSMDNIQQLDNMKLLTDLTKQATELSGARPGGRLHTGRPRGPPRDAPAGTGKGGSAKNPR
ncbi:hypothetical protein ACFV16_29750, partial [Streptomyces massasporeus]